MNSSVGSMLYLTKVRKTNVNVKRRYVGKLCFGIFGDEFHVRHFFFARSNV